MQIYKELTNYGRNHNTAIEKQAGVLKTYDSRHTDGLQVHEKLFNIINYQVGANQKHNEVSPHTCQNDHYQKDERQEVLVGM